MKRLRGGLIGLALAALLAAPAAAHAAASCNGLLLIDYVSHVGNTVGVRVTLGTGDILGGTKLTIDQLQFNLDCDSNFPLVPPCTDEGPVVEYEGDGTISTTCPVSWSTGHPVGTDPNLVVFTASPALDIPADQPTPPGFCTLDFDVKIVGPDTDGSGLIDELVGYQLAHCDNGILDSGGFQTADLPTTSPRQRPHDDQHHDLHDHQHHDLHDHAPRPPRPRHDNVDDQHDDLHDHDTQRHHQHDHQHDDEYHHKHNDKHNDIEST